MVTASTDLSVTGCTAEGALPCPMNHMRCCIVSLTGAHDDVVMRLMFSDRRGGDIVKIVCTRAGSAHVVN
jgi:hypothetical protein